MKVGSDDIRDMLSIINKINSNLNESYIFNSEKTVENEQEPETEEVEPIEIESDEVEVEPEGKSEFIEKIKEFRKMALDIISSLDLNAQEEEYKIMKTIWDNCDKLTSKNKIQNNK